MRFYIIARAGLCNMKVLGKAELGRMALFLGLDPNWLVWEYEGWLARRRGHLLLADSAAQKLKFWLTDEAGDAIANAHLQTPCRVCGALAP